MSELGPNVEISGPARRPKRVRRVSRAEDFVLSPGANHALESLIGSKLHELLTNSLEEFKKSNVSVLIVNHHYGDVMSGDNYQNSTGIVGRGAGTHAHHNTFTSIDHSVSNIDMKVLAGELAQLRQAMAVEATQSGNPEQAIALGDIASAEKSAIAGDAPSVFNRLKAAGKWALDTATKIGVSVAAKAIEGSMGM